MDIESIRQYCLSLPHTTEDMAFGDDVILFRVCDKIFACCNLDGESYCTIKTDPEYGIELREQYSAIEPAWHWNKKYWSQIRQDGTIRESFMKQLLRHSYIQVVKKLQKRIKDSHPEITTITEELE